MLNLDSLLNLIAVGAWILFLVYVAVLFVRGVVREGLEPAIRSIGSSRVIIPLVLAVLVTALSAAVVFIDPTRVAVVISLLSPDGVRPQPLRAGFHLIAPLLETDVEYPIAWQTYTMSGSAGEAGNRGNDSIRARTSDGQEVRIDTSLIFRLNPEQVVTLHIDWQSRYIEDLIRPVVRGVVRTEVSRYKAGEVNSSQRADLEASLGRILGQQFADKGILVDQFLIRDITFTDEYAAAVENKQIALEGIQRTLNEAEQMRNLAAGQRDRTIAEADGRRQQFQLEAQGRAAAILTEARAQADALKMIGEALAQNPNLLTYEYIDKLSPNIRVMLVPNNAPYLLPLPDLNDAALGTAGLTVTAPITVPGTMTTTLLPQPTPASGMLPATAMPPGS